ncbi:MAG: epoxyqueuosine reductase QueH [Endomicrobium sp.]|jgi:predicted adenine nucleotide alpha hydrolase (AANH) superfamily ATPase|nr:epoxyqueuosine reductase QueH [Endomicrobium sp.]
MSKPKLLLHICCAPCSASAVTALKDGCDISFYWFNPNIYDEEEYRKRKESAVKYAAFSGVKFLEEENFIYDYSSWKDRSKEICSLCYEIRLEKTALFAKNNGFDYFSTSLLSSPYQKHSLVKDTAEKFSKRFDVKFLYKDFRDGFYEGKNLLRRQGYYMQKYCACDKSYRERQLKIKNEN